MAIAERAVRVLRHPQVALVTTLHSGMFDAAAMPRLASLFDVVVDLYRPDWGDMGADGRGSAVVAVRKAPGRQPDPRPYPYRIDDGGRIVVRTDFYKPEPA